MGLENSTYHFKNVEDIIQEISVFKIRADLVREVSSGWTIRVRGGGHQFAAEKSRYPPRPSRTAQRKEASPNTAR